MKGLIYCSLLYKEADKWKKVAAFHLAALVLFCRAGAQEAYLRLFCYVVYEPTYVSLTTTSYSAFKLNILKIYMDTKTLAEL